MTRRRTTAMDLTSILPYAIFGGITLAFWVAITYFMADKSRATERLEELRDPTLRAKERAAAAGQGQSGMGGVLQAAAPTLSKALQPKTELEQSNLRLRLSNAGYHSPSAPSIYLAL